MNLEENKLLNLSVNETKKTLVSVIMQLTSLLYLIAA